MAFAGRHLKSKRQLLLGTTKTDIRTQNITLTAMKVFGRTKGARSKSPSSTAKDGGAAASKDPKGRRGWKKANPEDNEEETSTNNLSDLSNSSEEEHDLREQGTNSVDENSEDYERYERALRVKHSKACKAMSVRFVALSSMLLNQLWSLRYFLLL